MTERVATVTGQLGTFEGLDLTGVLKQRAHGIWQATNLMLFGLGSASVVVTIAVAMEVSPDDGFSRPMAVVLCIAASVLAIYGLSRLANRRMQERWYGRDVPRELTVTYAVTDEGLYVSSQLGHGVTYWSAINEVYRVGGHWILFIVGTSIGLPSRLFASRAEEGAFIEAVLQRLTPAARQRSWRAEKWVSARPALR